MGNAAHLSTRAAALAGAIRINFQLIKELEKTEPDAAQLLYQSIAAHLRSAAPMTLGMVQS